MNTMLAAVVLCTMMAVCQAATTVTMATTTRHHHTHHPHVSHATQEPIESERFIFLYTHSHHMLIKQAHTCWVATLTADEQVAVHTDSGLRALEIKLLGMIDAATPTTNDSISTQDQHSCGKTTTNFFTIP